MSHPSLFASPSYAPHSEPRNSWYCKVFFKIYLCSHMSLDDFEFSWLSANFGEQ